MNSGDFPIFGLPDGKICLASASPRRLTLLRQVGLDPEVRPAAVDERHRPGETPLAYVERMARSKALAATTPDVALCLGADTVVVLDGKIMGKPAGSDDATAMLSRLSGRIHTVLTGVAVVPRGGPQCYTQVITTRVWVKILTSQEICDYVASGEPLDKAGAYGIQGLGAFLVARIEGSYTGVVGLPLFETLALMRNST